MVGIILSVLGAWILADLITGLAHWIGDMYVTKDTPVLGAILSTEVHHENPEGIAETTYWGRNRASLIIAAAVVGILAVVQYLTGIGLVFFIMATAFASQGVEVHSLIHRKDLPGWVRMLQEIGIFQSKSVHDSNHTEKHDCCYCLLTNFLNPILDRVEFWELLEYLFAQAGLKPRVER